MTVACRARARSRPPLPAWIEGNDALSSLDEYSRMTPDERGEILVSVCGMATAVLNARPDQERLDWILDLRDPLPVSSRELFARLRRQR